MGRVTTRTRAQRVTLGDGVHPDAAPDSAGLGPGDVSARVETLAVEEPLQIRVAGAPLTVTMRTPGDDFDLALGLLVTEGLVGSADEVQTLEHCRDTGPDGRPTYNSVDVTLRPGAVLPAVGVDRAFGSSSACGICGTASIDDVRTRSRYDVRADPARWDAAWLATLPERLRAEQAGFDRTGGLHAAGLFGPDGGLLAVREDVGRHNAVDKLVGWAAREGRLPLSGCVLVVSSRASFELTQKTLMAGIPCLAAISAPSSLAVELAREGGLTLVGFLRPPRLTVYAGGERLGLASEA